MTDLERVLDLLERLVLAVETIARKVEEMDDD